MADGALIMQGLWLRTRVCICCMYCCMRGCIASCQCRGRALLACLLLPAGTMDIARAYNVTLSMGRGGWRAALLWCSVAFQPDSRSALVCALGGHV